MSTVKHLNMGSNKIEEDGGGSSSQRFSNADLSRGSALHSYGSSGGNNNNAAFSNSGSNRSSFKMKRGVPTSRFSFGSAKSPDQNRKQVEDEIHNEIAKALS
jgi:hypothetical protein